MATINVGELKRFLKGIPDDTKIYLSSDEEGNNYHEFDLEFGIGHYPDDKALLLYPSAPVEYEDMLPKESESLGL